MQSLFDDSATLKRVFCPTKACSDHVAKADRRFGRSRPSMAHLIDTGVVTWRTLLQTSFRTKVFLALSDDFSARVASDLHGRAVRIMLQHQLTGSGVDASVSAPAARRMA